LRFCLLEGNNCISSANLREISQSVRREIYDGLRTSYAAVSRVVSTEASFTAPRSDACFKGFQLVEIPEIMEKKMQASVGAALMSRWFSSPRFVLPENWRKGDKNFLSVPTQHVDLSIVKMAWVNRFTRANVAMNTLESSRLTTLPAAVELRRVLQRQHFLTGNKENIGVSSNALILHETAHLNSIGVPYGGGVDPLDCALAAFTMHVAVGGSVEPLGGNEMKAGKTHKMLIEKLHFYVRDSYDFNSEDEPLGYWGREGASASVFKLGMSFVENRQFRQWRDRHGRGGDFIIFSDVYTKNLPKSIKMENMI